MNHALAVMNDHKERFLAASNVSRVETDRVFSASLIVSLILSMYIILFLPLLRFPGKRPCSMRHSYSSFRMQCRRNLSFLSFNVAITVLLVFALLNTVAFATRSLYDIFKIRLRNHISAASRFLWSSGVMVQVSDA